MKQKFENLDVQQRYAVVLRTICNMGLVLLFLTFTLYVFGIVKPLIPLETMSQYWNLPLQEFLQQTGAPRGWQWLDHIKKADYLTFTGLIILAGVSGICYLVLLVDFVKARMALFTLLVIAELLLIVLAASNLFDVGH